MERQSPSDLWPDRSFQRMRNDRLITPRQLCRPNQLGVPIEGEAVMRVDLESLFFTVVKLLSPGPRPI